MKNLTRINKTANIIGLVFGILFSLTIFIGSFAPLGVALDTKAYIQSAIAIVYPIGLFIGLKRKSLGILICFASIVASVFTYSYDRTVLNYTYLIVFFLIQMLPVTLYILSWYYYRQTKKD